MSKIKTKSSRPSTGGGKPKPKGLRPWLHQPIVIAFICFVVALPLLGLFIIAPMASITKWGFLYIFGFDGKVSGRMDANVLMRNGRGRGFRVPSLVRNAYTTAVRASLSTFS